MNYSNFVYDEFAARLKRREMIVNIAGIILISFVMLVSVLICAIPLARTSSIAEVIVFAPILNALLIGFFAFKLFAHIKSSVLTKTWLKPYIVVEESDAVLLFGVIPTDQVHEAKLELLSYRNNLSLLTPNESQKMFCCALAAI
jgi:hypothetical protein